MATKKQKRQAAFEKGEKRREAERKVGLDALARSKQILEEQTYSNKREQ